MLTDLAASAKAERPIACCLSRVGKTGPSTAKFAPSRSASITSSVPWQETPYQKSIRRYCAQLSRRDRVRTEMNAVCSASQRNVEPVVYQDSCSMRIGKPERGADQMGQFTCAEILFTNLNPFDSERERRFQARHQIPRSAKGIAIRDVVTNHPANRNVCGGNSTNQSFCSRSFSYSDRGASTTILCENSM